MPHLFVYGTLKDPTIQKIAFGRTDEGIPDTLKCYRKSTLVSSSTGKTLPAIIPDTNSEVEGLIIKVSDEELARIDKYEDRAYKRINVMLKSGIRAWVYIKI